MISHPLKNVVAWVEYFDQTDVPVLTRTQSELAVLKQNEDNLNGREMADAILHDPLMTLKVLRYLHFHHSKRQSMEITTIARALMMLGTTPFFRHFARLPRLVNRDNDTRLIRSQNGSASIPSSNPTDYVPLHRHLSNTA